VKRSVERVQGVERVEFDLNTGRGTVTFRPGSIATLEDLWHAIQESGFTPVRIETENKVYDGPSPPGGGSKEN